MVASSFFVNSNPGGLWKSGFENEIFWRQGTFLMNFDFENGCNNEFKNDNEKSCRNGVSNKIDSKAVMPRIGHSASVGVKS